MAITMTDTKIVDTVTLISMTAAMIGIQMLSLSHDRNYNSIMIAKWQPQKLENNTDSNISHTNYDRNSNRAY